MDFLKTVGTMLFVLLAWFLSAVIHEHNIQTECATTGQAIHTTFGPPLLCTPMPVSEEHK